MDVEKRKALILVVDDKESLNEYLCELFIRKGYEVLSAYSGEAALNKVIEHNPDIVLTDLKMPGMSGLELLQKIKSLNSNIQVIVMTAYGTIDNAVEAIKLGAYDYLTKPFDKKEIIRLLEEACEKKFLLDKIKYTREEIKEKYSFSRVIGKSEAIKKVINLARKVLDTSNNVLITGESGVGKEVIAEAIHYNSPRRKYPFVKVSCAALPEQLLESELFGHEKGAFTGAYFQKKGRFELADGGTIFLDEIGEISPHIQVKLLRVLQHREFERVGGVKTLKVNVRVIAATNKNLQAEMKNGMFREDLYFRLNTFEIYVPPLRERKEDIRFLAHHFLEQLNSQGKRGKKYFSQEVQNIFLNYDWPGNVRELENVVERAYIISDGEEIKPVDLPDYLMDIDYSQPAEIDLSRGLNATIEEIEKNIIAKALEETGGNQSEAARVLKIKRSTLIYKMKKYGLL
jgi:DNA-binding NtrC family response regulator